MAGSLLQLLAELLLVSHSLRENVGGRHKQEQSPGVCRVGSASLCLSSCGAWLEQRGEAAFVRNGAAFQGQILSLSVTLPALQSCFWCV